MLLTCKSRGDFLESQRKEWTRDLALAISTSQARVGSSGAVEFTPVPVGSAIGAADGSVLHGTHAGGSRGRAIPGMGQSQARVGPALAVEGAFVGVGLAVGSADGSVLHGADAGRGALASGGHGQLGLRLTGAVEGAFSGVGQAIGAAHGVVLPGAHAGGPGRGALPVVDLSQEGVGLVSGAVEGTSVGVSLAIGTADGGVVHGADAGVSTCRGALTGVSRQTRVGPLRAPEGTRVPVGLAIASADGVVLHGADAGVPIDLNCPQGQDQDQCCR
jgi:hypothetical protein